MQITKPEAEKLDRIIKITLKNKKVDTQSLHSFNKEYDDKLSEIGVDYFLHFVNILEANVERL